MADSSRKNSTISGNVPHLYNSRNEILLVQRLQRLTQYENRLTQALLGRTAESFLG